MVDFDKIREQNRLKAEAATQAANRAPTEGERIDHTPLAFGKYKGKTPSDISETEDGASWLKWAKENVTNRPVCSDLLARDCGWKPPISPAEGTNYAERIRRNPGTDWDDMDDDIPF